MRFSEARLQAVSSRNMYSEQGLLAFILPSTGQVCQSFIMSSYCTPGSAQFQAAKAISFHKSRALSRFITLPFVLETRFPSASFSTAQMNLFDSLTELFEFCPLTVT